MKRTAYRIEGTVDRLPADLCLPDGVTVTEVEVEDPNRVEVATDGGNTLTLDLFPDEPLVSLTYAHSTSNVLLSFDSARQVRDFLNVVLDEDKSRRRVFRDSDDDLWWELEADRFTVAPSVSLARENDQDPNAGYKRWSLARLREWNDGPLIDVTSEHPEVNQ